MTIDEIITVLQNKLTLLQNSRTAYFNAGQIEPLGQIDLDIIEVTATLEKLKSL